MCERMIIETRFTHGRHLVVGTMLALVCFAVSGLSLAYAAGQSIGEARPRVKRIVSLGPTVTEKLYLLGAQDRLIGVTTYCVRPVEACKKEKVGNVTEVNVERIIELKPDVVFATSLTDRRSVENLKRLGMRLIVFAEPKSYAETNVQFLELGRMVGKEKEAQEIVEATGRKVDAIRSRIEGLPPPKVFVQLGAKPLFAATKGSFVNDFVEFAGGINIARDAGTGFYSREEVLKEDPDVIIIVGMDRAAESEKRTWQKFQVLKAVKNGRIFIMDSYRVCSPTPQTFVDALEEMVAALHPGA
jgi:iron complex transport system substrate-binding protein